MPTGNNYFIFALVNLEHTTNTVSGCIKLIEAVALYEYPKAGIHLFETFRP